MLEVIHVGWTDRCSRCGVINLRCTCLPPRVVRCDVPGCDWRAEVERQADIDVALMLHLAVHGLDLEFARL